ncbi:hypothetical protein HMPREF7545_0827 [Selenomonas noxia ATCC 43541]|nr:hypothetical protein HMPREF7545_0827 [Selenomonas noxia ATCC 43541]
MKRSFIIFPIGKFQSDFSSNRHFPRKGATRAPLLLFGNINQLFY